MTIVGGEELRRAREEVRDLHKAVDELRCQCDQQVKQLQDELNDEKQARKQLASDVERLKKIIANKLRAF